MNWIVITRGHSNIEYSYKYIAYGIASVVPHPNLTLLHQHELKEAMFLFS